VVAPQYLYAVHQAEGLCARRLPSLRTSYPMIVQVGEIH
jgi:hypothetical protein